MSRRPPAELGEVIGGYRLDELLNRGGMGSVYKATHAVLGRLACVKVLDRSLAMDDDYVARFLKEAKIVNDVRHENIVDIFDFVQSKNPHRVACIMEYIHGRTLKSVLGQGALTPVQSANAMLQLIDALKAVHAKGVVHRDLKPGNIMVVAPLASDLSVRPSVKVLDFGIAKVEGSSAVVTEPGAMLGTPAYMAPEQISGDKISPATDVYALGELFYEMLTARRVFVAPNAKDIISLKLLGEAPVIRLPQGLAEPELAKRLLERCLAPTPADRPSLHQMEEILLQIREANARVSGPSPVAPRPRLDSEVADTASIPRPEGSLLRRLGEYYCFAELPARGMTQTYVARKEGHVEICVLKRLFQHLEGNQTAIARFTREARIAQHLDHPRLAKMLDASIQEQTLVIATEFIIGQTLDAVFDRLLDAGKYMPLQVLAPIALGVLDGLAFAHTARDPSGRPLGIVHRDLTPNSIIVAFSGDVKIRDFGVARASVDDFKTAPGMAVGSIEYMSPEQARSLPLDHRSDLYTFSAVLYEALTLRQVVKPGATLLDTLKSVTGDKPTPLAELRPDIAGSELVQVIERGLEKDPARRWQSAAEYRDALKSAFGRFADASLDVVGDFLRELMPEEEQKAIELLDRIREIGEQLPAPQRKIAEPEPPHEPTMTVRRRTLPRESSSPEEMEPSVMTMPGAPAPLDRATALTPRGALAHPPAMTQEKRRVPLLVAGMALAAVVLVVAAIVSRSPAPNQIAEEPAAEAQPEPIALAPKIEPKAAVEEPIEPREEVEQPAAEPKPVKRVAPKQSVSRSPATKEAAAPPPPPPPPPPSRPARPFAGIRGQIAQLRSNPKDVKLFDQVLASIANASRDLPADGRRRVKVDLDAAERTYDVELLSQALDKLTIETAKSR